MKKSEEFSDRGEEEGRVKGEGLKGRGLEKRSAFSRQSEQVKSNE